MQAFASGSPVLGSDPSPAPKTTPSKAGSKRKAVDPGSDSDEGESSSEGEEVDEGVRECEKHRAYALDQLVAAMRFPRVSDEERLKVGGHKLVISLYACTSDTPASIYIEVNVYMCGCMHVPASTMPTYVT